MNASQYQVAPSSHDQVAISNFNQPSPQHHQMATFNGHSHSNYNVQRTVDQYTGTGYHQLPQYSTANSHDYQSHQQTVVATTGDVYSNVCNRFRKLHEHSQQQWQRYNSTYEQRVNQTNQEFAILHQRINNANANTSGPASKAKSKAGSNGRAKQYQRCQGAKTPQSQPSPQALQLPPQKQLEALQTQIQPAPQAPLQQQHPQQTQQPHQQRHQQQSQAQQQQFNYPDEVPYLDVNSLPPIHSNVQVIKQEDVNFGTGFLDGLSNEIFADAEFTGELLGEINGQKCWVPPADITSVFLNYAENCKMF